MVGHTVIMSGYSKGKVVRKGACCVVRKPAIRSSAKVCAALSSRTTGANHVTRAKMCMLLSLRSASVFSRARWQHVQPVQAPLFRAFDAGPPSLLAPAARAGGRGGRLAALASLPPSSVPPSLPARCGIPLAESDGGRTAGRESRNRGTAHGYIHQAHDGSKRQTCPGPSPSHGPGVRKCDSRRESSAATQSQVVGGKEATHSQVVGGKEALPEPSKEAPAQRTGISEPTHP